MAEEYIGVRPFAKIICYNTNISRGGRGSTGPVVKEMQHDFSHDQVFVLTTNGTMQIEKYDMEVYRTIDDHIYLNGVQKK